MNADTIKAAVEALKAEDGPGALALLEAWLIEAAGAGDAAPPADAPADPAPPAAASETAAPAASPEDKAVAASIVRLTAKADIFEALAEVEAWRASHITLESERAKLAKDREALEGAERRKLVGELVKLGRETPGLAWADPKGTKPAEPWASMPIATLRARVAAFTAAGGTAPVRTPTQSQTTELSPREIAMCAELKVDPKTYAAKKSALTKKAS